MIGALLLAALIGPLSPEPHPSQNRGLAVDAALLTSGAIIDLTSTEIALRRCISCREANPLGPSLSHRVAMRAATVAVGTLVCRRLRKDGHERSARVLGLLGLSGGIAAGAVNLGKAK